MTSDPIDRHPSEDDWARFVAKSIDAPNRARIIDHIAVCASCAELSRTLDGISGATSRPDAGRQELRGGAWRRGVAAVAAVILAAAGWSWLVRVPSVERAALTPTIATNPVASTEPVAILAAVAPWASLDRAPDVTLPASLTLQFRGEPNRNDAFLQAFAVAIAPYRDGKYEEAARAFEKLTASYPNVPEAWFYLGVSRLHAGDPVNALDSLRKAASSSEVGDEARWLEAVALERAGQHDLARRVIQELCDRPGPLRSRACSVTAVR